MALIPIASLNLWQRTVKNYLRALERALEILREQDDLPEGEPDLNRKYFGCLSIAIAEIDPDGRLFGSSVPMAEASNQPDFSEPTRTAREDKRPDISWGYRDFMAPALHCQRVFVIECKRLGSPTPSRWKLNENYVRHGVCRFCTVEHAYAKAHHSGAMIGYVQNMDFQNILEEVNTHIQQVGISAIALSAEGWQPGGVSRLQHSFERVFPVTPFELHHRWIDIRKV